MTMCHHGVTSSVHGSRCPQCADERQRARRMAAAIGLGLCATAVAFVVVSGGWALGLGSTPAPEPRDAQECGRLILAVLEGARKRGEGLFVAAPPGCVRAEFPPEYSVASSADGGAIVVKNGELVAWIPR